MHDSLGETTLDHLARRNARGTLWTAPALSAVTADIVRRSARPGAHADGHLARLRALRDEQLDLVFADAGDYEPDPCAGRDVIAVNG